MALSFRTPEPQAFSSPAGNILTPRRPPPRLPLHPRSSAGHSRAASADGYEKPTPNRLVEQFYRGGIHSKQSSNTEVSDINALLSGSRLELDTLGDKTSSVFGTPAKNEMEKIHGLVSPSFVTPNRSPQFDFNANDQGKPKVGYLSFVPVDPYSVCPENISSALVHVDRNASVTDMQPAIAAVEQTLQALWNCVTHRLDEFKPTSKHETHEEEVHPGTQLNALEQYLSELQGTVKSMHLELLGMTSNIKSRYLEEIQESMQKLNNLDRLVQNLSLRLGTARESMARNKRDLRENMALKLLLLDDVSNRFQEYDKLNRQRKGQQVIISLSIFVLAFAVGMVFFRWFNAN